MSSPDFRTNTDRLIARALREQQDELPDDFASQTAAFVLRALPANAASDRLESWLQGAALVALTGVAVVTLFRVGGRMLAGLASADGAGWLCIVAACVGLSLALQRVMQRRARPLVTH